MIRDPIERFLSHLRAWQENIWLHERIQAKKDRLRAKKGQKQEAHVNEKTTKLWSYARENKYEWIRRDFMTQHLVPGFRYNGVVKQCVPADVELAKRAVDRFDVVLDVVPEMHHNSTEILGPEGRSHPHHILAGEIPGELLEYLRSENDCDLQLYEYAAPKTSPVADLIGEDLLRRR